MVSLLRPCLSLLLLPLMSLPAPAIAKSSGGIRFMEPYAVEGLAVGATVAPGSWQYKRYKCQPSEQYDQAVACRFRETKDGVNKTLTILHLYNNVVTYINKSVAPAFFSQKEIQSELERLSARFGGPPRVVSSSAGVIASWGEIELAPLRGDALRALEAGKSPHRGFLVDYLMNFQESARRGLPVYELAGGRGFVWIARFAGPKEGALRFLAADPSQMTRTDAPREQPPAQTREAPAPAPRAEASLSTGTGFFVSDKGSLVTNAHVVQDCDRVMVAPSLSSPTPARILARDDANDLALLKIDAPSPARARLRAGVRIGEQIAVFGYPLVGLLSTNGNFTLGNVSATAGAGDDTRFIQISAPVQRGNSGGPVMDQNGNVVGVVVSKLNALAIAGKADDLAQNVNFAIKTTVLMNFLDANGVAYDASAGGSPLATADLAERAKSISALVACEKNAE
jgi:S1-C subfamily serine protease